MVILKGILILKRHKEDIGKKHKVVDAVKVRD
jgi:hypothetical protein